MSRRLLCIPRSDHRVMDSMDSLVLVGELRLEFTTQIRIYRDYKKLNKFPRTNDLASNEWIACMLWQATAYWVMIYDQALSVNSACTDAWIATFLVRTSLCLRAISVRNALGSTCRGTSDVSRNTRTNALTIDFSTLAIWSTRTWVAWILGWRSYE